MSNFSALIATIQANIKTNGNEEITGAVLQDVLKAMVQALGTEAINNLETALGNEVGNRQSADDTLQNNIEAEAQRAGTAEGVLQTAINGIKSNIDTGYVYAGIATPSGTPASGKVFYLAVTAGTYTNYGALVVTQGINILKYNGTAWSQEQLIALDNTPTPSSSGLVKSGGVFEEIMTNGSAFDLTVHNSGTTYADLSAALTAMDSLPAAYKKGGMSIKFVQSSDNKYVQFRLMSDEWSTNINDWAVSTNTIEVDNPDDGYIKAILDKNKRILFAIKTDGTIDAYINLNGNIVKIDEAVLPLEELKQIFFTVDNGECVSVEMDGSSRVLSARDSDGTKKEFAPFELMGVRNEVIENEEIIYAQIDKDKRIIEAILKDGTKYIPGAIKQGDSSKSFIDIDRFCSIIGLIANGLDNIKLSNHKKEISSLLNIENNIPVYINRENGNNKNLRPRITIIDDDTIDNQIPSSNGASEPSSYTGGYFSLLLPMMLSLGAKHNKHLPVGLACEGQRVGLTTLVQPNDNYTSLNENGNAVKWLHDNMGWNVVNHSMTAQLPMESYFVDGINSTMANTILANGHYYGTLSFYNTIVLDRLTGKWYEVNSTLTEWVERVPTKKYAMPFYQDYSTKKWYFNRDFDFDYSWGEWFKRADELGLPNERVIVHNGSTSHVYTAYAGRKYAYFSVRTTGIHNYPPVPAIVNRIPDTDTSSNNAKKDYYEAHLKAQVDECVKNKTWMVFMSHTNDAYHRNYYESGVEYPGKDVNYPNEWVLPLKYDEILDIIGENNNGYIENPPSRLGISSWDEWHPASGTQLKSIYDVLDYALQKGVEIVTPVEGWNSHGNILNIGVDRNGQTYFYDCESQTPYTDEEQSYLTVGADMSIRYFNKNS